MEHSQLPGPWGQQGTHGLLTLVQWGSRMPQGPGHRQERTFTPEQILEVPEGQHCLRPKQEGPLPRTVF